MRQAQFRGSIVGAAAVAVLIVAGCASTQADVTRWEGRPITELIAVRGEADRIVSYPYGGSVYIWEQRQTRFASSGATTRRGAAHVEDVVTTLACLVNEAGLITRAERTTASVPPFQRR